ncbi:alpha-glucosidase [Bacillus sp. RG28]|uniref:Alpha-amylase n=1 Tax=Gottfriedia endophytica TaxID=2820819 RepID=A0A940SGS8_9BACI|nr:alpha-glucosidase [Gottfriedia endophytica]MBP0725417.1 alpha-glucosidase [Gottfriedia endophytica]
MVNQSWWKEAVAYQIYPRSFMDSNGDGIGDLIGVISKLDYLKDLGIDVIWICPFYKSPNDDNGYDISDYQDIMDEFGTMEDFDQLLNEVHNRGMKLILDLVVNHTSDEHPWFLESRKSKDNPYRDYYIWHDGKEGHEPSNWESIFGGSAWEYDETTDQYYLHLFSKKQPDLNWENKEVRQEIYKMINWWLDKGIDGFRVDAISHIKKRPGFPDLPNPKKEKYVASFDMHMNQNGIHEFLEELKCETFSKYDIMTVGEANGVKMEDADLWVGEEKGKFNMIFQFESMDLWNKTDDSSTSIADLKTVLTKWQAGLEGQGWNALYIENHDIPRAVSILGSDDVQYWNKSAKAIATMYFFMKGTPFIYQGQEIGMTNVHYTSIDDYNDVRAKNMFQIMKEEGSTEQEILDIIWKNGRDNSRTPMQWNSEKNAGFTEGTPWMKTNPNYESINVERQKKDESSIFHFYKKMIKLRKEHKGLVYARYQLVEVDSEPIFAYTRKDENEMYLIIVNMSKEEQSFTLPEEYVGKNTELLLSNDDVPANQLIQNMSFSQFEARVYRYI